MNIKSILKYINNPYRIFALLGTKGMLKFISDELYLKLVFRGFTGRKLKLDDPKTFNEKLQWLKLYDRNNEYTKLVDKYEVRKYIINMIGKEYLIPLVGVWNNFEDIEFSELPNQFVLKSTHDSGGVVICKSKHGLNVDMVREKINSSLKRNFYYPGREWPYKNVNPRIICEKYMVDESGKELKDYKIFCFNGQPKIIQVDYDRFKGHKRNLYDTEWNYIPASIQYPTDPKKIIERPKKLNEMLQFARILAKDYPHVRIDFYSVNNRIYFGEMTFYHESGFGKFDPMRLEEKMGDWIKLPTAD